MSKDDTDLKSTGERVLEVLEAWYDELDRPPLCNFVLGRDLALSVLEHGPVVKEALKRGDRRELELLLYSHCRTSLDSLASLGRRHG